MWKNSLMDWRIDRWYKNQISSTKKLLDDLEKSWPSTKDRTPEVTAEYDQLKTSLSCWQTSILVREAFYLSIDVTSEKKPQWWTEAKEDGLQLLTVPGQIGVKKLIEEEKFARRERWVKLLAPIIGAVTGLVGAIIGLLAFLWSVRR